MCRKKILAAMLAACLMAGLAGCGRGGDVPAIDGNPSGSGVPDARTEQQEAIEREQREKEDAAREELEIREGNTKPYVEGGDDPNRTGEGMAGLGGDPGSESTEDPDSGTDADQDGGNGLYATDGNYIIPEGMPELTRESLGVPEWSGQPWAVLNSNTPYFTLTERPRNAEIYSSLDSRRRPGSALLCRSGYIDDPYMHQADYSFEIKAGTLSVPGWNEDAYPGVIRNIPKDKLSGGTPADGKIYYMRRLIGDGLAETAIGRRNAMVCTEYMGEYGLQALEDAVIRYATRSGKRFVYRVTPVFEGNEQIARGAVVEAMSYGDSQDDIMNNKDLCFNMFVYNVQPGVTINYSTGETSFDDRYDPALASSVCDDYVLDMSRKEAHLPGCELLVKDVSSAVQSFYYGNLESLAGWSIDWNACTCMDSVGQPDNIPQPSSEPDPETEAEAPGQDADSGSSGNDRSGREDMVAGDLGGGDE